MKAVIVADGDMDPVALRHHVATGGRRVAAVDGQPPPAEGSLVICADGGALRAIAAGVDPDLVIGDGDSLTTSEVARLRGGGVMVRVVPAEKDQSDTELCLREAIGQGATEIVLVGALGGQRFEHSLANVALLSLPELAAIDASIVHGPSEVRVIGGRGAPASVVIEGEPTDFVSLLPVGDGVVGVTTEGLRYPLDGEPLPLGPARGLSNELTGTQASVRVERGRLLIVHTRRAALDDALSRRAGIENGDRG